VRDVVDVVEVVEEMLQEEEEVAMEMLTEEEVEEEMLLEEQMSLVGLPFRVQWLHCLFLMMMLPTQTRIHNCPRVG
jgi:hypothetical protein